MEKYLLSCDWGTTSFRLRLVNRESGDVIGAVTSQNGVRDTYQEWQEKGVQYMPRGVFFRQQLQEQIDALAREVNIDLTYIPVVLSGMASSSIGMQEVAYAGIPFRLDGTGVKMERIAAQQGFSNEILLLSGVRSDHDVMRGEETQLIGLHARVGLPASGEAIFIFPGTHSKHMYVSSGQLVDFRTFMTGEVYNVMTTHSILKDSVELQETPGAGDPLWAAFREGLAESGSGFILNSLFTVRTNQLFDLLNKKQNALYLSGLLIGSEMRYLAEKADKQLVLCSGSSLFGLYKTAMEELGLAGRTTIVAAEEVDKAATAAHILIFEHHKSTLNKVYL